MSAILALEALEEASGSNAKTAILFEEVNNALLIQVFVASFDPFANYGVAKFTMPTAVATAEVSNDELLALFIEDLLPRLESRDLSGNAAKAELEKFLGGCTEVVQKWCKRILLKNLRCGVQATTVCKVWKGIIKSFNVQLASSIDAVGDAQGNLSVPGVVYPVMVDPKLDGLRCLVVKQGGEVIMYTRNGNEIDTLPTIAAAIKAAPIDDVVLDGEAMGADWNESSSIIGSTKSKKSDKGMVLNVFDCMTFAEWQAQKTDNAFSFRTQRVGELCAAINAPCVQKIPCKVAFTEAELSAFYVECLDKGYEGIMVKRLDGHYNFDGKRDSTIAKMKPVATYEGTVVGWYKGRDGTKNEGVFGGFNVLLPNGVVTNCGGGLVAQKVMHAQIMLDGPDTYIGRIVEMEGQPPLTKEGKVRFPVIKRYRDASDVDPKVGEAYEAWQAARA